MAVKHLGEGVSPILTNLPGLITTELHRRSYLFDCKFYALLSLQYLRFLSSSYEFQTMLNFQLSHMIAPKSSKK